MTSPVVNAKILACIGFMLAITSSAIANTPIKNHWNGKAYNENSLVQADWADRFFFQHYQFTGKEQVLDIGSGNGKLTARISDLAPNGMVMGIDNSTSMLNEAKAKYSDKPNLTFKFQDAQQIKFYQDHPNQFDLIVSFSTLHWVKDQKSVLQGIKHALKPNGKFYLKLSSKGGDPIQDIADELSQAPQYKDFFTDFHDPMTRFSEVEYQALLKEANLTLISIHDSEEQDKIQSKEKLIKQIKSWLPHYHFLNQCDGALAQRYIEEVIDTYLAQFPPTKEGTITLYDHYLEVVGEKR